ncbi:DUF3261 domain-containing protein [Chromobacterium alticapitis]|uniref:DUF3261 domain-containing protein n=1 Tax=Chromobacterium alticapitis TaxID=2073169 RepID=A0A2S5DDS4_9NEIS|nr:DUF3261 domain-containing protein [Chromobacterium alticapitis]POZ61117.1 DUF3261 domain-containing protein [Chromobacterium alticapitis]
MRRLPPLVFALLLAACQSAPPRSALPAIALPPASLGAELSLAQRLSAGPLDARNGHPSPPLDVQLEVAAGSLRLAGLALGQRILTLGWDGKALQSQRSPLLPASVDEARIVRDIQLAYWPLPALRAALPVGWTLDEESGARVLRQNGEEALRVANQTSPPWLGHSELTNRREGYRLSIDSAPLQ